MKDIILKNYKNIIIGILAVINVVILGFSIYMFVNLKHYENLELENFDTSKLLYDKLVVEKDAELELQNGEENYVGHTEDGTRISNSELIKKSKEIINMQDLLVQNVSIVADGEMSNVKFNIKNNSEEKRENLQLVIIFLDDSRSRVLEYSFEVDSIEAGSEKDVNLEIQRDLANAYDYDVEFIGGEQWKKSY